MLTRQMTRKVKKIVLIQPNYAWLNKRTWLFPPYTLCLLKANLKHHYDVVVFDPNFSNLTVDEVSKCLARIGPDLVGVTSISTEYLDTTKLLISNIRKTLPDSIMVYGGVIPTVLIEECMEDRNVDFWVRGDGEESLPLLIEELNNSNPDFGSIDGLSFWSSGKAQINEMKFIKDLNKLPLPDYSNIIAGKNLEAVTLGDYGNVKMKYAPTLLPRKYPSAVTITSRGCPYRCIFCAGRTVSGEKVRFRSEENVLEEIDILYKQGIREVIFLDDHFLADRKRAIRIINGILDRKYDMTWKCANVTVWLLDKEMLELMHKSGCTFIAVSIESGSRRVLKDIIKKPVNLSAVPATLKLAKSIGFDILVNFVVGFPGETWEEIRETFSYAEKLDADIINFHIATPLPKTELMDICLRDNLLPDDYIKNISTYSGYGKGLIATSEFTPFELEVLRSFEWDRINFCSPERKQAIARMHGITMEELEDWRINTRRNLGVNSMVKNIMASSLKLKGQNEKK